MNKVPFIVNLVKEDCEIRIKGFAFETGRNNLVVQFKREHQLPTVHPAISKAANLDSKHFSHFNNCRIKLSVEDALEYFNPKTNRFHFKNYELFAPENFYQCHQKEIKQLSHLISSLNPSFSNDKQSSGAHSANVRSSGDHLSSALSFNAQPSGGHFSSAPSFNAQSSRVQSGLVNAPNLELNLDLIKSLHDQQHHLLSAALSGNGQAMNLQLNANLLNAIINQAQSAAELKNQQVDLNNNEMIEKWPMPPLIDLDTSDQLLLSHDINTCHDENCPELKPELKPSEAELLQYEMNQNLQTNSTPFTQHLSTLNQTDQHQNLKNSVDSSGVRLLNERFRRLFNRPDLENKQLTQDIKQLDLNQSLASTNLAQSEIQSSAHINRRRLSASGASVGSGKGWYDKYGNYNLNLNSTAMPEELGLMGGNLRKWFSDFRSVCASKILENINGKIEVLNHRLFKDVYKYLPNDSCKLFWHEFVNEQGNGDFELFQDLFVEKFQLKFERDRFKNLVSSNLPLATSVYEIRQMFKGLTGESALLLLFCTLDESKAPRQENEIIKMMGNMKI